MEEMYVAQRKLQRVQKENRQYYSGQLGGQLHIRTYIYPLLEFDSL